jgi:dephospho-CoA kinase
MTAAKAPQKPVVLGIVGGIACGKSEVTRMLGELGGALISADAIAHRVLLEPAVIENLVAIFGDQILRQEVPAVVRAIDRRLLGAMVFGASAEKVAMRRKLEATVHPRIRQLAREELERLEQEAFAKFIVLDAPLLIEGGWLPYCDRIVMVESPDELRQKRAAERGWSKQQWMDREAAQLSLEEKRKHATDVLINDGSIDVLRQQVQALVANFCEPAQQKANERNWVPGKEN